MLIAVEGSYVIPTHCGYVFMLHLNEQDEGETQIMTHFDEIITLP